jgi:hypothetical protein
MSWYKKETPTQFDNLDIPGIFFLDGDILALVMQQHWTKDQKYPMVRFQSGEEYAVWESGDPNNAGVIHLFGEMDLRYNDTRDEAHKHAQYVAEQCGYYVEKINDNKLKLVGHDEDERLIVTYDNDQKCMLDVAKVKDEEYTPPVHPGHQLMTDEVRKTLPELYSNEENETEPTAHVKYFHPLSGWTWYGSEFDGEDILYGLVIGHEIEYGYFSLSELENIGKDGKTLPIERDLHHQPKTLKELKEIHEQNRGK